jgi:hypothetical protein
MITSIIGIFIANWAEIAGVLAALLLTFDRLAKITPTQSDNKYVEIAYKVFAVLGIKVQDNPGVTVTPVERKSLGPLNHK